MKLPSPSRFGSEALLIHDSALAEAVPGFSEWARAFPASHAVVSGEGLKDLDTFPQRMKAIFALTQAYSPSQSTLVVAGGGSVGDFGGFVASILKRGVKLVHFPSTWLAAIDSSHGGKTALNIAGIKNQIGTFYPAEEIQLVRELLIAQGPERLRDAEGELAKIALIDGGAWTRKLARSDSPEQMWKALPLAIAAKYRVVARDPFEKKEIRKILNLGHTLGHALEAQLGLPHGRAVAQGLLFAVRFSEKKKILRGTELTRVRKFVEGDFELRSLAEVAGFSPIPRDSLRTLLSNDKKRVSTSAGDASIGFVFLRGFGKPVLKTVSLNELLDEAHRQGWTGA